MKQSLGWAMLVVAGLAWNTPASAQIEGFTTKVLDEFLIDFAVSPEAWRNDAEAHYGPIDDAIWAVIGPRVAVLVGDPAYVDFIFARAVSQVSPGMTADQVYWTLQTIQDDATRRGVLRLSPEKQEAFLNFEAELFVWASANQPESCGGSMVPGQPRPGTLQLDFFTQIGPDSIARYYDIAVEALLAEIHDDPQPRPPSGQLVTADAMARYEAALMDALRAHGLTAVVMAGRANAEPGTNCLIAALAINAVWDLSPEHRAVIVYRLINPMRPDR